MTRAELSDRSLVDLVGDLQIDHDLIIPEDGYVVTRRAIVAAGSLSQGQL